MTNYPPTPAFGGFPLPAPRGPPSLNQDLRKLSINSAGSNNTTLPSPAIQSPMYMPKITNINSASRQLPSNIPSTTSNSAQRTMHAPPSGLSKQNHRSEDGLLEDREEGELSDAENIEGQHSKKRNNRSGNSQRDRGVENQQGKDFVSHDMIINSEVSNNSPVPRSQTWNEPYRRDAASHTSQGDQRDKRFNPHSRPKGTGDEKGNFRASGSGAMSSSPSGGPNNFSSFNVASKGMLVGGNPTHPSNPHSPLEPPRTLTELRSEAQRAVLNMIPLRVTWRYMVDDCEIDPNVLKMVYNSIGLPIPTETPSPPPSGDVDHPQVTGSKLKTRDKSSDRMQIDKDAQAIRKQLEKDARDRERKEAEAKAAELVRQREAAKEEEERKRRLAEVEAKKEVVRRKINEMGLPGKSASPSLPLTPISSTPVVAAIARAPPLSPPKPEVPRIPGLLLTQLDGSYSESRPSPGVAPPQGDTIMKDAHETLPPSGQPAAVSAVSNISAPAKAPSPERPYIHRRKRPVASDMYSEPMPTTKRKFGDHRNVELIIDISDDEEEEEEEDSLNGSGTSRSSPCGTDKRSGNITPPRLRPSQATPVGGISSNGNSKLDSAKALQAKEEQIKALKEAIQKAQEKKRLIAKTGVSTPTSIETPNIGTEPSVPSSLTQVQQQQVTDVAMAVSSALDNVKKEDEIKRKVEVERQRMLVKEARMKAEATRLKELQKKEQKKKIDALLTEIEEIEKAEAEKKRKEAEKIEAAKLRQRAREEKEKQLKEAENERLKKKLAKERVLQELARMRHEEEEMEAKKDALKAELAAMEKAAEKKVDAKGECDEVATKAISKKKEEIERLKKAMEDIEVDHATLKDGQESSPHELPQTAVSRDRQQMATDVTDDVVMRDDMDPGMKGMEGAVSTHEQVQIPSLDRTEVIVSRPSAIPSSVSINTSDAMDVDEKMAEVEKVTKNDTSVDDVDMDASSDEGDQEKAESSSEGDETSDEEEDDSDEDQPLSEVPEEKPRYTIPITSQMLGAIQEKPTDGSTVNLEEANLPTPVPEQSKQANELVDPAKITSTTAATNVIKKQGEQKTQRQPEHIFTPYKSPLTSFKSFRYHPNFLAFCPGGYRSLTFSNRIDPTKPLCRWELSGGICNDTSCMEQHKRQIEMPDDEILVELASVVEGSTEEERNNYNRGLRQTIASMRERGIKDFETVVTGIASYRRQFLGDETRVLKLPPSQPSQASQHQHHQQRGSSSFSYS